MATLKDEELHSGLEGNQTLVYAVIQIPLLSLQQRWPKLIRDLESATGSYTRALAGANGVVSIPRYQCRIFTDTDCSFVFVDGILNLLTAVRHCVQSVYDCVIYLTSGVLVHGVVYNKLKVTGHFWSRLLYSVAATFRSEKIACLILCKLYRTRNIFFWK